MLQLIGYDDITLIDCAGVDDDLQTRDGLFAEAIGQINVVSDPGRGRS